MMFNFFWQKFCNNFEKPRSYFYAFFLVILETRFSSGFFECREFFLPKNYDFISISLIFYEWTHRPYKFASKLKYKFLFKERNGFDFLWKIVWDIGEFPFFISQRISIFVSFFGWSNVIFIPWRRVFFAASRELSLASCAASRVPFVWAPLAEWVHRCNFGDERCGLVALGPFSCVPSSSTLRDDFETRPMDRFRKQKDKGTNIRKMECESDEYIIIFYLRGWTNSLK